MGTQTLEKLVGHHDANSSGNHVHANQEMGSDEGFKNVSKKWLRQCISFDEAFNKLAEDRAKSEDIVATVKEMAPTVDSRGNFAMHYTDGREFLPTPHAVNQLGHWSGIGSWFPTNLMENPEDAKGRQLYSRDRGDAETLAMAVKNGFRRIDEEKQFLWRVREDGTLRAMLTDRYAVVDNEWFLKAIQQIIPGGLVSHWKGDADTVYANILIPDTIRTEDDSDYGGMESVGNSEIGERRVSAAPSVFRAICMNGCIHQQTKGQSIKQVHRGKIDLQELFVEIEKNLTEQIPLVSQGIDQLLQTKTFLWEGDSMKPLFAQMARDNKLSKKQASSVLTAYAEEKATTDGGLLKSLFGVINAVTRAGQKLSNAQWYAFDSLGGNLAAYQKDDWTSLTKRAKALKTKDVEEAFAVAV